MNNTIKRLKKIEQELETWKLQAIKGCNQSLINIRLEIAKEKAKEWKQ